MEFYKGKIDNPFTPFSNGTEAMRWYGDNCDNCVKAFHPKDGNWPTEKTMHQYVRCGKYCKLQYWIDICFLEGSIPKDIAEQIGKGKDFGLKETCMFFSDNDDDRYKPPKRPHPDGPDNQLVINLWSNLEEPTEVKRELQLV